MYACLAVTCHLHFWQNDLGLLRATAVTRGWNGYRNKSQHRKSTLEKKILPPFQQGFEPATFRSRVRCSNHWAIPAPHHMKEYIIIYIAVNTATHHPYTAVTSATHSPYIAVNTATHHPYIAVNTATCTHHLFIIIIMAVISIPPYLTDRQGWAHSALQQKCVH